jgi:hypothetical protein
MPRIKRRSPGLREQFDSERVRCRLKDGHDWFWFDGPELTDEELAAAWEELGEEITAAFVREHPCRRPWGWWRYSAPEPRRKIRDDAPVDLQHAELYAGVPVGYRWETELEFLSRLNLLTESEKLCLTSQNRKPSAFD